MRGRLLSLMVLLPVLGLAGCAVSQPQDRIEERLRAGDTAGALEAAERLDSRRNQALYRLERGMLLRFDGDLEGSVEEFEQAKSLLGALEPISVTETVTDWAVAETADTYQASVHERLLLHVMQMLNFLELGDVQAARVEALQVDLGLRRVDPSDGAAPHGGDAFARYLSGVVFEASGDRSDALIAYRRAAQRYQALNQPVPRDLQVSLLRLLDALGLPDERDRWAETFGISSWRPASPDTGRLLLIVQSGFGPRLVEGTVAAQDPRSGQLYRISLPSVRRQGDPTTSVRISAEDHQADGERVESVHASVDRWVDAQIPLLTARALSRNVVRHQVSAQARDEHAGLGVLVNLVGFLFEQADTRLWRTLPDSIWMARLDVPAGEYEPEFRVRRRTSGEQVVQPGTVTIEPGGLVVRTVTVR